MGINVRNSESGLMNRGVGNSVSGGEALANRGVHGVEIELGREVVRGECEVRSAKCELVSECINSGSMKCPLKASAHEVQIGLRGNTNTNTLAGCVCGGAFACPYNV